MGWQVTTATLRGPRIDATLAMPGTDWIRVGSDRIRRRGRLTGPDAITYEIYRVL